MRTDIEKHYNKQGHKAQVKENHDGTITVEIDCESDEVSVELLQIEGYGISQDISGSAQTSWCERYGEITDIYIKLTYTPK